MTPGEKSMLRGRKVALFIPCLVDQVSPEIGLAMTRVLEHLGVEVSYDPRQTCCGQPAFNAGHWSEARHVAAPFIDVFAGAETIVCPSGSCTAMVRNYYPVLFQKDSCLEKAVELGNRIMEFSEFLVRHGAAEQISGVFTGTVGFHNSCHSYRELRVSEEPLALLECVRGYELVQPAGEPVCCGFGGVFSVKFDAIAAAMGKTRLRQFTDRGVDTIIANDPGCIMHMRQECRAQNIDLEILHVAEFLARAMNLEEAA